MRIFQSNSIVEISETKGEVRLNQGMFDKQMDGWNNRWIDEWERLINNWKHGWINGTIDGWNNIRMNG